MVMEEWVAASLHQLRVMESLLHGDERWSVKVGKYEFEATIIRDEVLGIYAEVYAPEPISARPVLLRNGIEVLYHEGEIDIDPYLRDFTWWFNLVPSAA